MSDLEIQDFRTTSRDSVSMDMADPKPASAAPPPAHPLDSEDQRGQLKVIEGWWLEQVDAHAESRREQLTDFDFYDHEQWDQHAIEVLKERNQAASTFNLIHPVIDWMVGTERRTRVDWSVFPRTQEAEEIAKSKEKLLKFVSDTSHVPANRSKAFKDAVIGGVGWTRDYVRTDPRTGIPPANAYVNWKQVRWDPYSRQDDLSDCRSISIERYIDVDYAIARWPDRMEELRAAASKMIDPALEFLTDDALMPQVFFGQKSSLMPMASISGTMSVNRRQRPRVRVIETEYRRPVASKVLRATVDDYTDIDGNMYQPDDAEQNELIQQGKLSLEDKLEEKVWIAIWSPGFLLEHFQAPYKHNEFSLTPQWCFRRHRDGMPYGYVRGLRDPQEEYNKRRSKALFAASVNRVIYESDAIDEADEEDALEEASRPDGQVRLAPGGMEKFKITTGVEITEANVKLMAQAKQDIHEGSSVTAENLGLDSNANSGRAILAKQQQGAVGTAELFDNYRQSIQISGQKQLSNVEQFMPMPMQIRVLGNRDGTEWLQINQAKIDPMTDHVVFENDITQDEADFVVDEQDYRETVRMAMAEMLLDTIAKMPPQLSIQLLDLAIELTDIPNRDEFVKRIRAINGADQRDNPTPEQQQQAQQDAQAAQAERSAQIDATRAKANRDNAAAEDLKAKATHTSVKTKGEAMNVATHVKLLPSIAPAADRLAAGAQPAGFLTSPNNLDVQPAPNPNGIPFPQMIPQR